MSTQALFEEDVILPSSQPCAAPEADPNLWGELLRITSIGESSTPGSSSSMSDLNKVELRQPSEERFVVGRDVSAHLRIHDQHVSSQHCFLFRDKDNVCWIQDNSLSGTFLKGIRIPKGSKRRLDHGDSFSLLQPKATTTKPSPSASTPTPPKINFYEFVFFSKDEANGGVCKGEILKKYQILEEIGSGSFAKVYRALVKENPHQEAAVKVISRKHFDLEPEKFKDQLKEIDMLKRLNNAQCVQLLDTYEVDNALYICMEYVAGGELFDRILSRGALSEANARTMLRRLVDAVAYLHMQGIVHRDLKPENILLVHNHESCLHIKVADFGVARMVDGGCRTITGSMAYIAPEVLDRQDTIAGVGSYSFEVDMWSIGVIAYVCLLGAMPFKNVQESTSLKDAVPQMFRSSLFQSLSDSAQDFLSGLFERDASKRFTAKQARDHAFIQRAKHCAENESCGGSQPCAVCKEEEEEEHRKQQPLPKRTKMLPPVPLFSQPSQDQ